MNNIYLVITPYFPSHDDFRGSYILDQVKALQKLSNYDIKIIKLCTEDGDYEYEGFKIFKLKTYHLPSSILPGFFDILNYDKLKKLIKNICDISKIDIVHSHSIYPAGNFAYLLKKEFNITTFIQYHGLSVFQENLGRLFKGYFKKIHNNYIRKKYTHIANNIDLNIGVSQKVIAELNKQDNFKGNTYTLYNGIDTSKFYKINYLEKQNEFIIGCIGNFWHVKDQITLLKAINEIKTLDIRIIFIGSGPDLKKCKIFVQKNNLNNLIEFQKEVSHKKLNDFYNKLDLFVLPSYYEALGCVYLEALQVGKPIIGIKNQAIEELIKEQDKENFLIDKSNYKQLANLITYHYKNRYHENYNYDFNIENFISKFLTKIWEVKNETL